MIKILKKICLLLSLLLQACFLQAQPFAEEIAAFKEQDSVSFPAKNAILFTGSSSFRMWKDVQTYFPGYPVINRGFGGSTFRDMIRYANDIIFPYAPKQILIYCGDNDLASNDSITAKTVTERFKALFFLIRSRLPSVPIAFISIKPSPSRWRLASEVQQANKQIKDFLKTKKKTAFIDVYHKMLDENGQPMKDIFLGDNLHMNAKGYAIWQKAIKPYLLK